jgi:hypothetical protein
VGVSVGVKVAVGVALSWRWLKKRDPSPEANLSLQTA